MAFYGRNSIFVEAAQETPQATENSTLELVTCGSTARWHSSRRPDTVGRDEMFSLSETELLELCIHFHQYKIKTITKIKPLSTTSRLTTLLNNSILYTAISENTEIFDGNYPSIPIFGPIVGNTDFFGVI